MTAVFAKIYSGRKSVPESFHKNLDIKSQFEEVLERERGEMWLHGNMRIKKKAESGGKV